MGVWAGDCGPDKCDRQPLFFAYPLVKLEASASPRAKGNKKNAVTPHLCCPR